MSPCKASLGAKVAAKDKHGHWYTAKVTNERGEGAARELRVHFLGWGVRYDEWVLEATHVEQHLTDAQLAKKNAVKDWKKTKGFIAKDKKWIADRILRRRRHGTKVRYLVRWEGWDESHDSWEPKAHLPQMAAEFEEKLRAERAPKRACADAGGRTAGGRTVSKEPYVIAQAQRPLDVSMWRDAVAGGAAARLQATKEGAHERLAKLFCPAAAYVALHAMLRGVAERLHPGMAVDALVTDIAPERGAAGGEQISDFFYVASQDVLAELLGPAVAKLSRVVGGCGALAVHRNGTVVQLLPSVKFEYRTTRSGTLEELVVTGGIGALVWGTRTWDWAVKPRADEKADEKATREAIEQTHKDSFKYYINKLATETPGVVPDGMVAFLV